MDPPLKLFESVPVRTEKQRAFVDGPGRHGIADVEVPVYSRERDLVGNSLREFRVGLGVSLRQAAITCGLRTARYSDLERGAAYVSDYDLKRIYTALLPRSK